MRIAVNTRLLLKDKLEGIGWFTFESLKRITCSHPEHTFYFIFDRKYDPRFVFADNVVPVRAFPPARHPYLWYAYFEYAIPLVLKKLNPDLFFSPDGWLSLRTDVPQVNVIHDLNFEHRHDFIQPNHQDYYTRFFPKFAKKACRIATVSEFSKQDIHRFYGIDENIIDVVYNGINDNYKPLTPTEQQKVRNEFTDECPYFLFVSAIHKRKNLANILRAFDAYKQKTKSNAKFLVVGARAGLQGDIDEVYQRMAFSEDVIFTGHIVSERLAVLMASAIALVYASYFEGFGIPIVEAFRAETPVITSNVTAMPEVAGDAALLVNPDSVEQIADAMAQLETDETLRRSLIDKGKLQGQKFSWDQTADRLWQCLEKALADAR